MFSFFLFEPRVFLGAAIILAGCYFLCVCIEDARVLLAYWQANKPAQRLKTFRTFDGLYEIYAKPTAKHDIDLSVPAGH